MRIIPYGRFWAVYDHADVLICVCVYKKGAQEVLRRLQPLLHAAFPREEP